LFTDSLKEAWS